tara:strand:- start:2177 stop:2650 length:474 start_codon:yes stop_codon:yes gene_type:complete
MIKLGYVSLRVELNFARNVYKTIKNLALDGMPIKAHDMHMTLMYDKENPIPIENAKAFGQPQRVHDGVVKEISMLGIDDTGRGAVVLIIESESIAERHEELSFFMKHSFDPFVPHISVAYDATEDDFERIKQAISVLVIGKSVVLYGESFAELKKED